MAPIDARKKLNQIRKNKNKNNDAKVNDLRQVISRKTRRTKSNDRSPNKAVNSRISKVRSSSRGQVRDLRETNKKLASRRNISQTRDNRQTKNVRPNVRVNVNDTRRVSTRPSKPSQQYYVPPHLQHQHPATFIITAPSAVPQSNLAMDNVAETQGASILISNLPPSITQSDIIELFAEHGVMTAVNMINQTTALVTYQNSANAVRAIKMYHNRLLDGKPMLVNMMPTSATSTNVRSRIGNHTMMSGDHTPMDISYDLRRM